MEQEIELTLTEQGELKVKVEDKSLLAVIIKGLGMINCDQVGCENCQFDCEQDCRDCPFELKGDRFFDCMLEKLRDIASND